MAEPAKKNRRGNKAANKVGTMAPQALKGDAVSRWIEGGREIGLDAMRDRVHPRGGRQHGRHGLDAREFANFGALLAGAVGAARVLHQTSRCAARRRDRELV